MYKIKCILLSFIFFLYSHPIIASEYEVIRYLTDEEASKYVNNLFEIDRQADLSINYDPYTSKLDIGIGEVNNNLQKIQHFTLLDLQHFFSIQKHKKLIVIWFCKSRIEFEILNKHINKLIEYFFASGYKRVVILQGLGNGASLYSDTINPRLNR